MRTDRLDYDLPPQRIATRPAEPRDAARLMLVKRVTGTGLSLDHHQVHDLPQLGALQPGDLMVVNESKVIPAWIAGRRTRTHGRVQGLFLAESNTGLWRLMLEARGKLKPGESIRLEPIDGHGANDETTQHHLILKADLGDGMWRARLQSPLSTLTLLERLGRMPLPPYIRKARRHHHEPESWTGDAQRYQTVYSNQPGSTAAPTAGLHFTTPLLDRLEQLRVRRASVTLHVGPGTFTPVRSDQLEDHPMHAEQVTVPRQTIEAIHQTHRTGNRVLMVGTTTVRAVESVPAEAQSFTGPTSLFITPDRVAKGQFTWRYTDMLLTNFHLPRSTLLAMVAALPGMDVDSLLTCYRQAIDGGYRFYSYGDAMLIV